MTQTIQEGDQEVSFSINASNISFGPLFVSYCQQLSWNGKKWCYRTYILSGMFSTYVSLFLKRKLRETGSGVIYTYANWMLYGITLTFSRKWQYLLFTQTDYLIIVTFK